MKIFTSPAGSSPTRQRRLRSNSEQNYLLRHAKEIDEMTEIPEEDEVKPFFEALLNKGKTIIKENFKKPQVFKNVDVDALPFGMSVYQYHAFAACVLLGVCFTTWTAVPMYLFCWWWQIFGVIYCFFSLKRPDYNATREKYNTHHDRYMKHGVTILKPLHGVPERLATNLETYFNLKYPKYELLLCIKKRSGQEKLIQLCESLMKKYPKVKCKISFGFQKWGINPKVCNMGTGYDIASYNLVWIADANIVSSDSVLQDMVSGSSTAATNG
jgi:hypothetical protein